MKSLRNQTIAALIFSLSVPFGTFADGSSSEGTSSIESLKNAANQGWPDAERKLGLCYERGDGVDEDDARALYWYTKAAEQGDDSAQYDLGLCYRYGKGTDIDKHLAAVWFRKAADQGDADAKEKLAELAPSNEASFPIGTHMFHLQEAADDGDGGAALELGLCYYNGDGVPVDYAQAVNWFRKAAQLGHSTAMLYLGYCYQNGTGVSQDQAQASFWFQASFRFRKADEANSTDPMASAPSKDSPTTAVMKELYKQSVKKGDEFYDANKGWLDFLKNVGVGLGGALLQQKIDGVMPPPEDKHTINGNGYYRP